MSPRTPGAEVADRTAAQAIVAHHAQLAAELHQRVAALLELADNWQQLKADAAREGLLGYLRREILPHARAEEQTLYPPAAALPDGRLLVAGMVEEHRALTGLVAELAEAGTPVRAAAAARALDGLFAVHLQKENELVLPLLLAAPGVRLAEVLTDMHELVGTHEGAPDAAPHDGAGGCGCGGACGGDGAAAAAPVLSVDARLDVRDVPHGERHALVLSTVAALPPGQAVVLVAPHAPRPVLAEIDSRFGAGVRAQWLQSGPDVWQIRLERVAA